MKNMTIRNVPEDLHRAIVDLARRNHRSIQQQVIVLLERARRLHGDSPTELAASWRRRLEGRELGDTVEEIREERTR